MFELWNHLNSTGKIFTLLPFLLILVISIYVIYFAKPDALNLLVPIIFSILAIPNIIVITAGSD